MQYPYSATKKTTEAPVLRRAITPMYNPKMIDMERFAAFTKKLVAPGMMEKEA